MTHPTAQRSGNGTYVPQSWIEAQRKRAALLNREAGSLSGVDCPDCRNKGWLARVNESGDLVTEDCHCKSARRSLERIRRSGLSAQLERYTLDTWQTNAPWRARLAEMARAYIRTRRGWFYVAGSSGAGKTHICTAICGELIRQEMDVLYALWRDMSVQAKAQVNDAPAYRAIVEPLKTVPVLYIDDFFKSAGQPTTGDINLAYEIINSRYNDPRKLTIFSSETTIQQLLGIDEALGGRIYERTDGRYADLSHRENWRLANG